MISLCVNALVRIEQHAPHVDPHEAPEPLTVGWPSPARLPASLVARIASIAGCSTAVYSPSLSSKVVVDRRDVGRRRAADLADRHVLEARAREAASRPPAASCPDGCRRFGRSFTACA